MTEKDDDLLKTFFEEYAINIPDNGFSQQVMRQLPHRFLKANQVWFWFCTLVGIAFLALSDAMEQLLSLIHISRGLVMIQEMQIEKKLIRKEMIIMFNPIQ